MTFNNLWAAKIWAFFGRIFHPFSEYEIEVIELEHEPPLGDVPWLVIGSTNEYAELKRDIAHTCRDVTRGCCIDEICIHDIVKTFERFGYSVVKT